MQQVGLSAQSMSISCKAYRFYRLILIQYDNMQGCIIGDEVNCLTQKKKYARVQMDYLAAKEHFLLTAQNTDKRLEKMRENGAEQIGEIELQEAIEKSGFHKAFNELLQAENRLIEWSHLMIKQEPIYKENIEKYERLFSDIQSDQDSRAVLIKLAMDLNAHT
jgi:hypothetical protein